MLPENFMLSENFLKYLENTVTGRLQILKYLILRPRTHVKS